MRDVDGERTRLEALNREIARAEDEGDTAALHAILAMQAQEDGPPLPLLAFRRASGICVDARTCLDQMTRSGPRRTEIVSIELEGQCLAIVRCHIHIGDKRFLNIRLFIRNAPDSADWRLLGWANEEVGEGPPAA